MATTTTTATPPTTATTLPNGVVPSERAAIRYYLKIDGNQWENIINNNYTDLESSIRPELASKFYTGTDYVVIWNMTLGSLLVDFSVYPSMDGTQIRESEFLASYNDADISWLSSTQTLYKKFSSNVAFTKIISSTYQNSSTTQPPINEVCSDGCVGAISAAGVIVFVLCVFVAWAWMKFSKQRDFEERRKLGVVVPEFGLNEPNSGENVGRSNNGPGIRTKSPVVSDDDEYDGDEGDDQEMYAEPVKSPSMMTAVRPRPTSPSRPPLPSPRNNNNSTTTMMNNNNSSLSASNYAMNRPISVNRTTRSDSIGGGNQNNTSHVFRPPSRN